ncbi:hypothetical protein [Photobacterium angustum]|uniref:hypothetical protein n=1 Tax=Photobacterium angustum TaxID=661 RepID=UPI00069C1BE0|nr:hypothetical protein [Photobacterium angustum]
MSSPTGASPFCIPCERSENWIEFLFVDEHNVPFKNIHGQLTDASGATIKIQLKDEPTLVKTLAPGPVTLMFDNVAWLNESQQRTSLEEAEEETVSKRLESVGYDSSSKKLITATAGDFVELQSGQVLPPKHVAEAEGEVTLITNNSYVIKIKGFNYITFGSACFSMVQPITHTALIGGSSKLSVITQCGNRVLKLLAIMG